jgi:hypothetical protein
MNHAIYFSAFVFLLLLALLFLLSHQLSRFSAPRSMLQSGKAIDRTAVEKATLISPHAVGLFPDPVEIRVSANDQPVDCFYLTWPSQQWQEAHFRPELMTTAGTTIGMTNIGTAITKGIGTATKDTGNITTTNIRLSKPDRLRSNNIDGSACFLWNRLSAGTASRP